MKQIIPLLLLLRGVAASSVDINDTQNNEQSQRQHLQQHRENVAGSTTNRYDQTKKEDIKRSMANPPGINRVNNNYRGNKPGVNRQHNRGNAPGINRNQSSNVSHHRGANKRNIIRQKNRKNNIQYRRHKKRGNAYRNGNNSNGRGRGGIKKKNQMRNRYGSISVEKNTAKPPPSPPIQDLISNTGGKKSMLPYPPQSWYRPPPPPNTSWNPPPQGVWGELLEVEGEYSVSSKSYKQRGKGKSDKHRGGSESLDVNTNIGWQQYSPPPAWKKPSWSSVKWNTPPKWISPTTWEKPPQQYHPSNNSWKPANIPPPPKMDPEPISWEPQQELEAGTTSRYTSPSGIKMCPCENKPKMPLPRPPSKSHMMPYSTKNTAKDPSNPILSGGKANRSESHADTFVNNKKDRKELKKHIRESGGTRQEVKDYESNSDMRLLSNWGGPSPLLCPCKTQPPTATPTTYMPTTTEPEEIPEPPSTYFPTWSPTNEATTNEPSPKATTAFPSFSPTYSLPTFSPSDSTDKPVKPLDTMIPTYSPTLAYPTFSPSVSDEDEVVITISDEPTVQPSVSPIAHEVETTEPSISPITTASLPTYSPTYKWPTYSPTGATTTSFSPTTSSIPSTNSPTSTSSPSFRPSLSPSEDTSDTPSFIDTPSPILSMTPPPTSGMNSTEETTMSPTAEDSTAPTIIPLPTTTNSGPPVADSDATLSTSPSVSSIGTASPSLLLDTQSPSVTFSTSSNFQACPDELIQSYNINAESTLYYAMVPSSPIESNNGILCARLEVLDNDDGWIGVGFSSSGTMENSQAVIGIYDEDTVLKYDLAPGQASPMSDDKQTLQNASITTMDGKTIMEFTKLLVEDDEVEILEEGENIFLHAWGGSALGYHTGRLSFTIDFSEDNKEDTSRPVPPLEGGGNEDGRPIGTTNSPTLSLTPPPTVIDNTIELAGQLKEPSSAAPSSWYPTYSPTILIPLEE